MSDAAGRSQDSLPQRLARARETGLVVAILIVVVGIIAKGEGGVFFSGPNTERLLRQIGLLGIFAVGEAVVIIAGGIDLSVGSLIGFAGMLCAILTTRLAHALAPTASLPVGLLLFVIAATVGLGALIGGFHTFLITKLRLPPFIATLSTLAGLRSGAQLVTNSVPVTLSYPNFRALGEGLTPLWLFLFVAVGTAILMRHTALGRRIVAMGGNEEAARLSGLVTERLKLVAYCLSGALAGLAGVLYAAYTGQGDPRTGVAYELQAIAAAVVGGCSLNGGVGSVTGTVLGVTLLQLILNGIGLVIKRNSTLWQGVVVGVVVVLAVALNEARQRRLARPAAQRP